MTNLQIIEKESQRLAEEGVLKYTGRVLKLTLTDGSTAEVKEVEPIHTFAIWKDMGRSVKKGEHAKAKIIIWKCAGKKETVDKIDPGTLQKTGETEEVTHNRMFMKKAFFFTYDQTEPLKK